MNTKPILVTGADGQLGLEFLRQLGSSALGVDQPQLDISDPAQVTAWFAAWKPKVVINCAAYTAVDRAEDEPEACRSVNRDAVQWLAEACAARGATLIHISTDYVFGAERTRNAPYRESDPTGPLGVYGQTKLEGERCAATCPQHLIVRTCGLYGLSSRRNNFVEAILRRAEAGQPLRVVQDQYCTPSYVRHVAGAVLCLWRLAAQGLYHVVNEGATTWYEFACEIVRRCGLSVPVQPIPTSEYPTRAQRPGYSVLDTSKYRASGGPALPSWSDAVQEYLVERR